MSNTKTFFSSSLLNFLSTISKVIYSMLVASLFGATSTMDTFVAAVGITLAINALLNNSQANTLIPFLAGRSEDKGLLLSRVINFNLFLSLFATILVLVLSPLLIHLIAPGLDFDSKSQASTLLRILSINILFNNIGAIGTALLKLDNKITTTYAFTVFNAFYSLLILSIFRNRWGIYIFPFIQISAMIPIVLYTLHLFSKKGVNLHLIKNYHKKTILEYSRLLLPVLSAWVFVWIIKFTDNNIASRFNTGSMSYLSYCSKILNFSGILPSIVCSMTFPHLSKLVQSNQIDEYKRSFYAGFSKLLFIIVPIGAITFLYSKSIVSLMFQRGSFTPQDSYNVSLFVKGYILVIVCAPIGSYLSNVFFAYKKPVYAMKISVASSILNVVLNIILSQFWGVMGLMIASSIAFLFGSIFQAINIHKVQKTITFKKILRKSSKTLASTITIIPIGLITQPLIRQVLNKLTSDLLVIELLNLVIGVSILGLTFTITLLLLKEENILQLMKRVFPQKEEQLL